ncbi:GDSL esterase/lipase At5g08460 [Physcomitrium patens]|uniref:Uncharacterized protein n=3 Tax=Physcomitrium patens TaxID=3218 RepID=A0A2K1IDA5_PHYPA|nr:hypothetical protein PHYPA_029411 [Physcomitrium patens]
MTRAISKQLMQWVVWLGALVPIIAGFSSATLTTAGKAPLVPALFIFGDSLADPGNNNHLISLAKSNHPPYGRQFDTHMATGRFTNGRTAVDFLAEELGLPLVPPFLDSSTKGQKLLQGVNYASAGSGILNSTGMFFGEIITTWKQLEYFRDSTQPEIYKLLGKKAGEDFFRKSIFYLISGSNDFVNGYYFLIPTTPHGISIQDLMQLLISTVSSQLKVLYDLGVRKVGVAGLAPLGCCPSQITKYNLTAGNCVEFLNDVSEKYNDALKNMLLQLREELEDFHLVYSNLYDPLMEAINNPAMYGFNFTHAACCGVGKLNGKFICIPYSRPCDDPQHHIFFDYYHPTSRMYDLIFRKVYFNGPPFSIPYSGQFLVNLTI